VCDATARAGTPSDRPLGRHRPHALGLAAPRDSRAPVGSAAPGRRTAPPNLLLQAREERLHVDLAWRQNPCRSRGFLGPTGHPRIIAGLCYGTVSAAIRSERERRVPLRALLSHHTQHRHSHALVDPATVRSRAGIRAVSISLAVLTVTAAAQTLVYALTSSVALLADLIHNFGDASTAIPLGIAF